MAGELNTIGSVLKYGATALTLVKLCPIKDYPDLGGAPEMLPITDLDDDTERNVPGVQSLGAMEFTANYTEAGYDAIVLNSRTPGFYGLEFGTAGADGIWAWQGQHTVYVTGGSVGAVREMKITIAASSKPVKSVV